MLCGCVSGRWVSTTTPNAYRYNHLWATVDDRSSLTFRVRACNDAHLALASVLGDTSYHTYEVVIGASSNQYSVIRNMTLQNNLMAAHTPDILSCDESRPFWLSWAGGLIQVGRGTRVSVDRFIEWQETEPYPTNAVAISTGWGATGEWQFTDIQGYSGSHYFI